MVARDEHVTKLFKKKNNKTQRMINKIHKSRMFTSDRNSKLGLDR